MELKLTYKKYSIFIFETLKSKKYLKKFTVTHVYPMALLLQRILMAPKFWQKSVPRHTNHPHVLWPYINNRIIEFLFFIQS